MLRRRSSDDGRLSIHSNASTVPEIAPKPARPQGPPRRQSSFAKQRPDGTPRTPNRVRFDVQDGEEQDANGHGNMSPGYWMDQEDPMDSPQYTRSENGQNLPLLTSIEAPSVTVAQDYGNIDPEDALESARPKSGMKNAFMNMANSIIGAGIIGQPYAFRQAGLMTGIILLVSLTVVVDWTIRLIVINSKLSGSNSFQATMEHCFGRSGLIAISVAQWAL